MLQVGCTYKWGDRHNFKLTITKITKSFITFDLIETFGGGNSVEFKNVKRKIKLQNNKAFIDCNQYFKLQHNILFLEHAEIVV